MAKNNTNCWEYFKCGCEPGGKNSTANGVCPAAALEKYDGINNGKNGGRFCWLIEETVCNGTVHDSFFDKIAECFECEFYMMLQKQDARVSTVKQKVLV